MKEEKPRGMERKKTLLAFYEQNIRGLRSEGYSYPQIQKWLENEGVVVSISTVQRFLRK